VCLRQKGGRRDRNGQRRRGQESKKKAKGLRKIALFRGEGYEASRLATYWTPGEKTRKRSGRQRNARDKKLRRGEKEGDHLLVF